MKAATSKYSEEAKRLLSGKIREFSYTNEVRAVLKKRNIYLAASYIRLVVLEFRNQDDVWDAVTQVLIDRKEAERKIPELTANVKELVEA